MGPAESINAVEIALRDLIEQILGEKFGADWINECGSPEKIQQWNERKIQESKQRDAPRISFSSLSRPKLLMPISRASPCWCSDSSSR